MILEASDTIQDTSYSEGSEGIQLARSFVVSGVTGEASARQWTAARFVGISRGQAHPTIPKLFADQCKVEPMGATTYRVTWTYTPPNNSGGGSGGTKQNPVVRVGSSLVQVVTNKRVREPRDAQDDPCLLEVSAKTDDMDDIDEKVAEIQKLVPCTVIQVSQIEKANPAPKAAKYTGLINSSGWKGFPARTVLCTRIEGTSNDGEETFETNYEFQVNLEGWDVKVYYVNDSNEPLTKDEVIQSINNGAEPIKSYTVYQKIDFNGLGLNIKNIGAGGSFDGFTFGLDKSIPTLNAFALAFK